MVDRLRRDGVTACSGAGDDGLHDLGRAVADLEAEDVLHKTGTRAVESEGLTTQRWAVLGALSRPEVPDGMAIGDLTRYLKVSRQSLAGIVSRLEDDGIVVSDQDPHDRRSRRYRLTPAGRQRWHERTLPRIERFYDDAVAGLSIEDISHALHYLVRLLDNMTAIDERHAPPGDHPTPAASAQADRRG